MKLRILVVDDDQGNIEILRESLNYFDFDVLSANNGSEGLVRIKTEGNEIDLVISDVEMPVMNGLEMLKRVRIIRPELPVIITSGLNGARSEALKNGADDFLLKPSSLEKVRETIARVMESRKKKEQCDEQGKG